MIKITFEFPTADEAAAALLRFAKAPLDISAQGVSEHNAREAGATGKSAAAPAAAAGQRTAKGGGAQTKTAAAPAPTAESAEAKHPGSTAATGDAGNGAAGSSEPEATGASPASSSAPVEYKTLKEAVFKLAGLSRDAAIALNQQFGVKTMKDLAEDRWPEALAAVQAKLAELGG